MARSIYIIGIFIVILLFGCKKEEDIPGFSYLDIENAYGIVIGNYRSSLNTDQKLFKISSVDKLEEVKYLDNDKEEVHINRIPVAIYSLNKDYFLVTFKYGTLESKLFETFVISRFDGKAQKIIKAILPEKSGTIGSNIDDNTLAIRHDNNSNFYFKTDLLNYKMDFKNQKTPLFESFLEGQPLNDNFIVDYLGNILTTNKIHLVSGKSVSLQNTKEDFSYPLHSFINNLYYITRVADSVQVVKINAITDEISEEILQPYFYAPKTETTFINSHLFADYNKIVVILSNQIIEIKDNKPKVFDLKLLNLKKIFLSSSSDNNYYIYGENAVNDKVFVKIDPSQSSPVYTQIVAPNYMEILRFSVSENDKIVFSGTRIADSKGIYGYIPGNSNNWIFEDDQEIDDIQVLVR